jgi:predicted nucleic acid-binding protein
MYVVLDSNVIIEKDWHLTSPAALALLEASSRGGVGLVVPEIVVREVTAKHREREAATLAKLENARSALRKLQASFSSDDHPPATAVTDLWGSISRSACARASSRLRGSRRRRTTRSSPAP